MVCPALIEGAGTVALKLLYKSAVPAAVPCVPVNEAQAVVLFNVPKVTFVISSSPVELAAELQYVVTVNCAGVEVTVQPLEVTTTL